MRRALEVGISLVVLLGSAWAVQYYLAEPERAERRDESTTSAAPTLHAQGTPRPPAAEAAAVDARRLFEGFSSKDSVDQMAAYDVAVEAERIGFDEELVRLMVAWLQSDNRVLQHRANVVLLRMGPRVLPFTEPLLRSDNDTARCYALTFYAGWKGRGFKGVELPPLLPFLEDDSSSVQGYAMALVTRGIPYDPAIAAWLRERIRPGPGATWYGPEVALANMGDEGFAEVFAMLDDPKLRYNGLGGLRGAPPEQLRKLFPRLEALIADDRDEDAQVAAVRVLHRLEGDFASLLPTLTKALQGESYPVRVEILMALEQMEERAAPALEGLLVALADRDDRIASQAAGILKTIQAAPARVLPALAAALQGDAGRHAAAAMGAYGARAVPYLQAALDGSDEDACYNALHGVAALGPEGAPLASRVLALLDDEDYDMQVRAASTLGALGAAGKAGIPVILRLLHEDVLTPGAAAGILMQIGPASEAAVLAELRSGDEASRLRIVTLLSAFRARSAFAIDDLAPYLSHANAKVRLHAVTAVSASTWSESMDDGAPPTGDRVLWQKVRAMVAPRSEDPDPRVRSFALDTLQELDGLLEK